MSRSMVSDRLEFINEEFFALGVEPHHLDLLLADGWRHFGQHFFRYSLGVYDEEVRRVIPLRVRTARFAMSKSQRRVWARNAALSVELLPLEITGEITELFERHKKRFKSGTPESIFEFISEVPVTDTQMFTVRDGQRLVAASFFDVGRRSLSSIYGIFEPDESPRGLGILTMLHELELARSTGKAFYYHGYAYEGESFYDYKKRFSGLEAFDWHGSWLPYSER